MGISRLMGSARAALSPFAVARRVQSEGEALPTGVPQVSLAILIAQSHNSGSVRLKPAGAVILDRDQQSGPRQCAAGDFEVPAVVGPPIIDPAPPR
jgi:hypothetical protein